MLKPLSNVIKEVNISRIFEQNINILSDIDDTVDLSDNEIKIRAMFYRLQGSSR